MRSIWSGSINFGLVNIPIKLYSGSQSNTLDLDMLRKSDLCPVHFARVCRSDGKEIPYDDIVRGYEYKEGDYVVLTDKDMENANVEKTKTIDILNFIDESEIDTVYYEKPYYLEPEKSAGKIYVLLKEALIKSGKVGIARYVLRNRENLGIIKPYGDIILLNQLRYHDEVRSINELKIPEAKNIRQNELDMAVALIDQLTVHFRPEKYKDTYIEDLKKLIEQKAKGKKPVPKGKAPEPSKVKDIMALLKESLKRREAA